MEEDPMMIEDSEEEMEDARERIALAESMREHQQFGRIIRGPQASEYLRQYAESLDDKGEPLNAMVPPEKFVHQSFFNGKFSCDKQAYADLANSLSFLLLAFDDDFDDEDIV